MGVSSQTIRVRSVEAAGERRRPGPSTGRRTCVDDAAVAQHALEHPVRAAVDVVAAMITCSPGAASSRDDRGRRRAAREGEAVRAALERRRRPARAAIASGSRSARTPSRRAAARRRPGRTCWSGRWAARRRPSARRAPGRRGRRACSGRKPSWIVRSRLPCYPGTTSARDGRTDRSPTRMGSARRRVACRAHARSRTASMSHPLVTVIGAGNVGATTAQRIAEAGLADVVLVDIVEGLPQGKALDLAEAAPVLGHDCRITGTNDYADTAGSDVIVVTSGLARQPGMSRDDLLAKNAGIVRSVGRQQAAAVVAGRDPHHRAPTRSTRCATSRSRRQRLPARSASSAWPACSTRPASGRFIAAELGVSVTNTHAFVLGGHGDTMVPLPRYSTVGGVPITELLTAGAHRGARRPHPQRRRRGRRAAQDRQRLLRAGRVRVPDGRRHPQRPPQRSCPAPACSRASTASTACSSGVPVQARPARHRGDRPDRADRRRAGRVRRVGGRGPGAGTRMARPRRRAGRADRPPTPDARHHHLPPVRRRRGAHRADPGAIASDAEFLDREIVAARRGARRHPGAGGGGLRRAAAGPLAAHRRGARDERPGGVPAAAARGGTVPPRHRRAAPALTRVDHRGGRGRRQRRHPRSRCRLHPAGRPDVLHVQLHASLDATRPLPDRRGSRSSRPTRDPTRRRCASSAGRWTRARATTSAGCSTSTGWTPDTTTCRSTPARLGLARSIDLIESAARHVSAAASTGRSAA